MANVAADVGLDTPFLNVKDFGLALDSNGGTSLGHTAFFQYLRPPNLKASDHQHLELTVNPLLRNSTFACHVLSIIKYQFERERESNECLSYTLWKFKNRKGRAIYIYIYIYICVCVNYCAS